VEAAALAQAVRAQAGRPVTGIDDMASYLARDITKQDVYAALRAEHSPERPHLAESFVEVSSLADPAWMIETLGATEPC
jgi:hypothetical protein